jgi:hypothetical protein
MRIRKLKIYKRPIYTGYNNPPTYIKVGYYKNSNRNRSPAVFEVREPNGLGKASYAKIRLDPILKRKGFGDLRRDILKHEKNEIDAWERGSFAQHWVAKGKEGKLTSGMKTPQDFWREIDRRKNI